MEFASLWQKCDEILQTKLAVSTKFKDSYLHKKDEPVGFGVNLINKQVVGHRNSLPFDKETSVKNQQIPVKGFALLLRIDDSYALGLKFLVPEKVLEG